MRTIVRGGTVVTAVEEVPAEVLIDGERIVALVAPGSEPAESFARGAHRVIDATGRLVVPGGVDAHTHFQSDGQSVPVLDTFETGTRAAVIGGTTSIVDFASPLPGTRPRDGVDRYHAMADGQCAVDYGFHLNTFGVDDDTPVEMDALIAEGITSFKMYMAYPGLYSTDAQILRVMQQAAHNGGLVMMHAENGPAIDVLREQAVARGETAPIDHARSRPAVLEAEAVHRAAVLSHVAGVPVYLVHLSSADALAEVVAARDKGWNVFGETCPQYLFLSQDELERPDFEGARFVCSPPLRPSQHASELWRGLRMGDLHVVATDHCPFCWAQRQLGRDDFRLIPNGLPSVEHRMELLYEGVVRGHITRTRWIELCATTPAKMFGLHPRKGTLAPGSDADLVVFDPQSPHVVSAATHSMNVDYSVFEGMTLTGRVDTVLLRGDVVVDGGVYTGRAGQGRFVRRDVCSYLR